MAAPSRLARPLLNSTGLGCSVGMGWPLLFYSESIPPGVLPLLNFGWVGGLLIHLDSGREPTTLDHRRHWDNEKTARLKKPAVYSSSIRWLFRQRSTILALRCQAPATEQSYTPNR